MCVGEGVNLMQVLLQLLMRVLAFSSRHGHVNLKSPFLTQVPPFLQGLPALAWREQE